MLLLSIQQHITSTSQAEPNYTQQLSVPVAIRGLLSISSELCKQLSMVTRAPNAPSLIRSVQAEISAFHDALDSVSQTEMEDAKGSLVVSLTDAVLLFDEIKLELQPVIERTRFTILQRTQWARKSSKTIELVNRLQWHKSTIALQLSLA